MDFLSAGFSSDTPHYFAVSIAQPLGMLTQLADPGVVLEPLPQFACICVVRPLKYKDAKYLTIAIRIIFQLLPVRYVIACVFSAIHRIVCWEESFISESHRTFLVDYFAILCFSICHTFSLAYEIMIFMMVFPHLCAIVLCPNSFHFLVTKKYCISQAGSNSHEKEIRTHHHKTHFINLSFSISNIYWI